MPLADGRLAHFFILFILFCFLSFKSLFSVLVVFASSYRFLRSLVRHLSSHLSAISLNAFRSKQHLPVVCAYMEAFLPFFPLSPAHCALYLFFFFYTLCLSSPLYPC